MYKVLVFEHILDGYEKCVLESPTMDTVVACVSWLRGNLFDLDGSVSDLIECGCADAIHEYVDGAFLVELTEVYKDD